MDATRSEARESAAPLAPEAFAPEALEPEAPPPSPHERRIVYLDGWRGVAVLLVLVGHFGTGIEWLAGMGVQLFFALSGRLMTDILFVERFPLAAFYRRRISRIYPGVLVFVLLAFLALRETSLSFKPLAAVSALTFTLNYPLAFGHGVPGIENLWSLCIEEHSYVLLGAIALVVRARRLARPAPILLAVAGLSLLDAFVSVLVLHQGGRAVFWRTDSQLAPIFLAAGGYLALRDRRAPAWLPLAALAGGAACHLGPDLLASSLGTALFSLAVASFDDAPAWARRALANRGLVLLGLWSYSLYLYQQPFSRLALLGELSRAGAVALTFAAGVASFYLVEQPARRWLNANWRPRRPAPPVVRPADSGARPA